MNFELDSRLSRRCNSDVRAFGSDVSGLRRIHMQVPRTTADIQAHPAVLVVRLADRVGHHFIRPVGRRARVHVEASDDFARISIEHATENLSGRAEYEIHVAIAWADLASRAMLRSETDRG